MGSMLNINQLARKENLVIHLDASVANYTAYEFNSGSRNGTSASILDWPNRWTDLSGNNNHGYVIRATSAPNQEIATYSSSFYNITSSYLNNGVNIFGLGNLGNLNDRLIRFNPINGTTNFSYSIFTWVKFNINNTTSQFNHYQPIISKRTLGTVAPFDLDRYFDFGANGSSNSGPWYPVITIFSGSGVLEIFNQSSTVPSNTWVQYGFTIEGGAQGSGLRLYVNGTQVANNNLSSINYSFNTGSRQIVMGRMDWASNSIRSNFNMSQLLAYDCALTPQEVWDNYQITKYKHQT
jgi:hypothetical protein